MTAIENYATIIDGVFGKGTTSFSTKNNHSNPVIGALKNDNEYQNFKANFIARLNRLKSIYEDHPNSLREIIVQVNEISSLKNWDGAFAELSAYDLLNYANKDYLTKPILPNITLPNTESFALELGKQATNLDGYVEDYELYFDVKCLKDNVNEILEGIYRELKRHLGTNEFYIVAEHALDTSYDDYKLKRRQLLDELKTGISVKRKEKYLRSSVIENLTFRLLWGSGIQTSEKIYNPYSHAENCHKNIFNYSNKFMKNAPTIIILGVFPWYNQIISDFADANVDFYRAFARRAFCQYQYIGSKFNEFNSSFNGQQTIFEISNYLSAIIFLEDKTILSEDPSNINVRSFSYLNPNAKHPITKSSARQFINLLHNSEYDDFENDNY